MVGAIVIAVIAYLLSLWALTKKRLPLAALGGAVGAAALLVGFPQLLFIKNIHSTQSAMYITALIGLVLTLMAFAVKSVPNGLAVLGVTVLIWALVRAIPNLALAFQGLGPDAGRIWSDLLTTIKNFISRASSGKSA